jgi:hypothetical protein
MPEGKQPTPEERDEPVAIPLDPEEALRGLLNVDPDAPVVQDESEKKQGDPLRERHG